METLENWIHRRGALLPLEAVGWIIRLSKHLESLHVHGVAHGCVSPACVLIETSHPMSRGQVADVRRTAEAIGFHSPERLRDGQLSPVDDAWGLAATLYKALTGATPFGETRQEISERQQQLLVPLSHYRVDDNQLHAILAAALIADPRRRTANVATFRMQLEHWSQQPGFRHMPALEDEEGGEDDQGATAMLPMEGMLFDENQDTSSGHSVRSTEVTKAPMVSSAFGEQDATVMRELPAHIIALAARAAGGSSPPPPPAPPSPDQTLQQSQDEDFGQTTRIATAPQLSNALAGIAAHRPPAALPPMPPSAPGRPMPPSRPQPPPYESATLASPQHGLEPPVSRPRVPRAFKSTQLGVGAEVAAAAQQAVAQQAIAQQTAAQAPQGPRAGFAPPPTTLSTNPPPRDHDDVRTVMHQAPSADLLAEVSRLTSGASPMEVEPEEDDDDDGQRTVMREAPVPAGPQFVPPAPPPPRGQWAPAPPPVGAPFQATAQTDRPPAPQQHAAPPGPHGAPPGPQLQQGTGSGVSALISETLSALGPPNDGASPPTPNGGMSLGPGGPFVPQGSSNGQSRPFSNTPHGGLQAPFGDQSGLFLQQQQGTSAVFPSPAMQEPQLQQQLPPNMFPPSQDLLQPGPNQGPLVVAPPQQQPAKSSGGGSKLMLVIVCLLVLVLAAAVTFLALKFRAQIGF